jgi:phage regulator Rha-like protein
MRTEVITAEQANNGHTITSIEIARVTGKQHKDVMKAIRMMEPAWEQERGRKFSLSQIQEKIPNGGYKMRPCYIMDKSESLFVASKFNDRARARLVLRWTELESKNLSPALSQGEGVKMLETEREIMQRSDEIMKEKISLENEDAVDCFTMSQVARSLRMKYEDLCRLLKSHQIITEDRPYELLPPYNAMGFEAYRYHEGYKLDGTRFCNKYMVWTPEGMAFVRSKVNQLKIELR